MRDLKGSSRSQCDEAVSNHGFYLTFEAGILDSEKYCSVLDNFIPYANARLPYGWVLQLDYVLGPVQLDRQEPVFLEMN